MRGDDDVQRWFAANLAVSLLVLAVALVTLWLTVHG